MLRHTQTLESDDSSAGNAGFASSFERPTFSGVAPAGHREELLQAQDEAATRARLRTMLLVGFITWMGFFVVDWLVCRYDQAGSYPWMLTLRTIGAVLVGGFLLMLFRQPPVRSAVFRVVDQVTFVGASLLIALMALEYRGVESPYFVGIIMVMICRASAAHEHWRRGLLSLGAIAAAYPLVMLGDAWLGGPVRAQLAEASGRVVFAEYVSALVGSLAMVVLGSHRLWTLRRQVYEARLVGRYRLKRCIGVGGMGEVWQAQHLALKRDVAVKILRRSSHHVGAARFQREFLAASALSHPNTVRVFDYGTTDDGMWYYAMELLEGETIEARVSRAGPRLPADAVAIATSAARALAEAHQAGIVHRDVKPSNIMLTQLGGETDFVKVIDFGIATFIDSGNTKLTETGLMVGTPAYMSPEVLRGDPVTPRTDVYALGAVLHFMLTGEPPHGGQAPLGLPVPKERPLLPPLDTTDRVMPEGIDAFLQRSLATEPEERFSDGREMASVLAGLV